MSEESKPVSTFSLAETDKLQDKVSKILAIFMSTYPNFNKSITTTEQYTLTLQNWSVNLRDLTDEQLMRGVKRCCSNESFMPTIARFKFIAYGLVDTAQAFELAKNNNLDNPVIYEAYHKISQYYWRSLPEEELYRRFARIYGLLCDQVQQGKFINKKIFKKLSVKRKEKITFNEFRKMIFNKYGININSQCFQENLTPEQALAQMHTLLNNKISQAST